MRATRLEYYFKDVVKGRKRGVAAFLLKAVLLPLSWVYGFVIRVRNLLYEKGWMRLYVPPVPLVISVGNIVAGGTGKTPVTLFLAKAFGEKYTIAILSRGYRSKAEKLDSPLVLCEGAGPVYPATYCGDEPYLFAQRFPKSIVIVGGDRKKASCLASKIGAEAILLDDGMQHRRLARDFDIVVVDVRDPFGQGYLLPRGFLREDKQSLKRASLIILNHIHDLDQFTSVQKQLSNYSNAPVVGVRGFVSAIKNLKGEEVKLGQEVKIGMFCAIANPDYFRNTLEKEGCRVISQFVMGDHEKMPDHELEQFAQKCEKEGAEWLICTEKDRVKLSDDLKLALPILWIQLDLSLVAGQQEWDAFLKQAEAKLY